MINHKRRQIARERRSTRFTQSTAINAANAITIARLHADNAKMRAALDDIDAQVRDLNIRRPHTGAYMLAVLAIRRILQEWKS